MSDQPLSSPTRRRPKWVNIVFFALTLLAAIGGLIWLLTQGGPHGATWILAVFMLFATGMSITAGYHNFHHVFQGDYRNGIRAYQYDPTKWLIGIFARLGMARNLRLVSRHRILAARLATDSQCYLDRLASCSETVRVKASELLESSLDQLQQAHLQFMRLKADYHSLKGKRLASMKGRLSELRLEMRRARYEFKAAWIQWTLLMNRSLAVPA